MVKQKQFEVQNYQDTATLWKLELQEIVDSGATGYTEKLCRHWE